MSLKYFDNFNTIKYNGRDVINVLSRAKILDKVMGNPYAFYPLTLRDGDRADAVARNYYKDPFMSWLVYLSDKTIDPFYDWYLTQVQFQELIESVYGGQDEANRKVICYRVNWDEDPSVITQSQYDALVFDFKKYWNPMVSSNGAITGYERAKLSWQSTTNYYQRIGLSNTSATFVVGDQVSTSIDGAITSHAEVYAVNSTSVTIRHVRGDASRMVKYLGTNTFVSGESANVANSTYNTTANVVLTDASHVVVSLDGTYPVGNVTIRGLTSNAVAIGVSNAPSTSILTADYTGNSVAYVSSDVVSYSIPHTELVYWSPFTSYEMEDERNSENKHITVLDSAHALSAYMQLKNLMR